MIYFFVEGLSFVIFSETFEKEIKALKILQMVAIRKCGSTKGMICYAKINCGWKFITVNISNRKRGIADRLGKPANFDE